MTLNRKSKKMIQEQAMKTVGLTTGIAGLGIASGIAAGIPGTTGLIARGATQFAGLGLMAEAAPKFKKRR